MLTLAGAVLLAVADPYRSARRPRRYTGNVDHELRLPDQGPRRRLKRYLMPRRRAGKWALWFLLAFLALALFMLLGLWLPFHNILVSVVGWVGIILAAVSFARERCVSVLLLGGTAVVLVIAYVMVQLLQPA